MVNFKRLTNLFKAYSTQFWLIFFGMLISQTGMSMVWPFLLIYVSKKLDMPLTTISLLLTANSLSGIIATFLIGPILDRFGRKWVLIISLLGFGLVYLCYNFTETYLQFLIIMSLSGIFSPVYRVASDTMLADIIPSHQRAEAYSLLRLINNVGVAIGPAVGGFIAAISYSFTFCLASAGLIFYGIMMILFSHETLQAKKNIVMVNAFKDFTQGYKRVLSDKRFVVTTLAFTLVQISATLMWILMPVFIKTNYGISEAAYGFLPTTNAVMIVVLQLMITRRTRKKHPLLVMALGALVYSFATLSVAWGTIFIHFWLSMVVMTIGELIIFSISSTYIANLSLPELRGRYMAIFSLAMPVAYGIAPVMGGLLNDQIGPQAIWYGGAWVGLAGMAVFLILYFKTRFLPEPAHNPLPD